MLLTDLDLRSAAGFPLAAARRAFIDYVVSTAGAQSLGSVGDFGRPDFSRQVTRFVEKAHLGQRVFSDWA